MVNIIFLGTAGSSSIMTKQFRASAGIVIQFDELQFHLDPGPGALVKAKEYGINPHHTTAVLVSNNSLLACNDLNAVVDAMTHSGIEHRGLVIGSKTVLEGDEDVTPYLTSYHRNLVEKIIPLTKGHKVGIEHAQLNALPVKHSDPTATGFIFHLPKFSLGYTSDTAYSEELLEALSGCDILILNVQYPDGKGEGTKLNTQAAIKVVAQVRPKIALLTGFGLEMLKADPLQQAREVQRITGVQTVAAYDGLKISSSGFGVYKNPIKGYNS